LTKEITMTATPPPISFGDHSFADLTGAGPALVRAAVEGDAAELDALALDLDRTLLAGSLLGPLLALGFHACGSFEGVLAWMTETHAAALGEAA
jgi:hypothetical protein